MLADPVVEDFGGGSRQRSQTGCGELLEEAANRQPQRLRSLPHFEGGEGVQVQARDLRLDRPEDVQVEVAREVGVDPALQGDLGGTPLPGLPGPVDDLRDVHQVGLAPQVQAARPLGEGTEPAAEVAEIRVVDVAIDDVGHGVADRPTPELIGGPGHRLDLGPPRPEQHRQLVSAGPLSVQRALENGADRGAGASQPLGGRSGDPGGIGPLRRQPPRRCRHGNRLARCPVGARTGRAGGVDLVEVGPQDVGVEEGSGAVDAELDR